MKRKIYILSVALGFNIVFCFGQRSAYYDALYLKRQIDSLRTIRIEPQNSDLFTYYFRGESTDAIEDSIELNPFLKDLYRPQVALSGLGINSPKGISFPGSLNVTKIADGIARFLIKRGTEELNVAFFNRMKKFLDDPKHPEGKTLFPVTTSFLGKIATYRYAELIQSLREAFHNDLSNLIIHLNQLIDHPKYTVLLKELPEIRAAVRCSKIVSELSQSEQGIMPDSLIHELALTPEFGEIHSNLGNSFKFLDIISQSVRELPPAGNDTGNIRRRWIQFSDLNNLVKDQVTLNLFIGLLYQRVKLENIQFRNNGNQQRVDAFLEKNKETIYVITGLIENFALMANEIDAAITDIQTQRKSGSAIKEDFYTYINKVINITEYGFNVANIIRDGVIDDKYIIMARNANQLYKNVYTKNYNDAVMNVYTLLNQVFVRLPESGDISSSLRDSVKIIMPKNETIEKVLKYGNFMASVVKAESAEDVENALEASALPAGSFSLKQKSALNISVNGYIGYTWDFNNLFNNLHARGVYAPVGISISRGSNRRLPAVTGFISLIDVGGIAAYRLENGNTDALKQEVRLESIFSPSALALIEPFRGFPLAFGIGWRRTPKLFFSNNTDFITSTPRDVFTATVIIDIPMFTIINKQFVGK